MRNWARLVFVSVSRAYRAFLFTLIVVGGAPVVLGWASYVVESGSMRPAISVGNVVVTKPTGKTGPIDVGRVYVFDSPTKPGETVTHRVVGRTSEGSYVTAGDANEVTDSLPVQRSAIRDQPILLVPFVGLPLQWLETGNPVALIVWVLVTMVTFLVAGLSPFRTTPKGSGTTPKGPGAPNGDGPPVPPRRGRWRRGPGASGRRLGRRSGWLRIAASPGRMVASVALGLLVLSVSLVGASGTSAAFTANTGSGSNSWTVGQISQRYVAEVLADKPYLFYLLDEASGAVAVNRSTNNNPGDFTSMNAYRRPGALPNNFGYSVSTGATGRVTASGAPIEAPDLFSLELWFNTTSGAGGTLVGFESTRNATSNKADRHVHMDNTGRLVYGAWDKSNPERRHHPPPLQRRAVAPPGRDSARYRLAPRRHHVRRW